MSERPEAIRKRNMAAVRPLSDWAKMKEGSGIEFPPRPALSPRGEAPDPSPPAAGERAG